MRLKIFLITTLIAIIITSSASANSEDVKDILTISRMKGLCGAMESMVRYQDDMNFQGGDEFMTSFWSTEASKLGMDMKTFMERCRKSNELYKKLWEVGI